MLNSFKEIFTRVTETAVKRVDNNYSGPFLFTFLLVFWEIPIVLFFSDSEKKILKMHEILDQYLQLPYGIHIGKIGFIIFAWFFWVFVFPALTPFFNKWRSWLIDSSEALNNYESYAKLVTGMKEIEKNNELLKNENEKYKKTLDDLKEVMKINNDSFKHILKMQSVGMKLECRIVGEDQSIINEFYNTQNFQSLQPNVSGDVVSILEKKVSMNTCLALLDDAKRMCSPFEEVVKRNSKE